MTIPGFTAEVAFYSSKEKYYLESRHTLRVGTVLLSQQCDWTCVDNCVRGCPPIDDKECIRTCLRACCYRTAGDAQKPYHPPLMML